MRKEYVNIISKYKEEFNLKSLRHHRKSQSPKIEHQGTPHFIICTEEEVSLNWRNLCLLHIFDKFSFDALYEIFIKIARSRSQISICYTEVSSDKTFKLVLIFFNAQWIRFRGVMVSTLDSESSDPSSNLGGTCTLFFPFFCIRARRS